jgi:hypothetical protein
MELPRPGNSGCKSGLLTLGIALCALLFSSQDRDSLGVLLDRAADNARRYTDAMRNLTAEEVRLTELFDKSGKVSQRRETVSDLVVHTAGSETLAEFRNVREVDGKVIKGGADRLENLSRRLSNADSLTKELELIDLESSRYDLGDMRMRGMALNQAWPLEDEQFRKAAKLTREGAENISGRDTIVVRYEMSRLADSPQTKSLVEVLRSARLFTRGRIWIDLETAQIWRYETETMVQETPQSEPLVWDRMEFYYVPSPFEIPTPRKIVWISNSAVSREKGKLKLSLKGRVTAEYGMFKRFGTEIKIVPVGVQ